MATAFKLTNVIDPDKCLLEDFEIIAFEREEDSDLYTYWHDQFKGRSLSDPLRLQREQKQQKEPQTRVQSRNGQKSSQAAESTTTTSATTTTIPTTTTTTRSPAKVRRSHHKSKHEPVPLSPSSIPASQASKIKKAVAQAAHQQLPYVQGFGPQPLGNGLSIINSLHINTMIHGKILAKYKLTKFYNKLRGRQMRRNLVIERQKMKKLDEVLAKCQLNTWLAYTSLQALHLPGDNVSQLSTIAINHNPRLITIPQSQMNKASAAAAATATAAGSTGPNKKKKKKLTPAQQAAQSQNANNAAPMHFVYIDPNDIVTYSNRICPQQIIEYRKRSHLLPSSATSKRSSAASYDVFEIMDVLSNSDKTNVTITRNANKPAPAGCSIYSHSTNMNTRGIVSTQLHLQARTYLEMVGKFYAEERVRLAEEEEKMRNEPSIQDQISKYIKTEHAYSSSTDSPNMNSGDYSIDESYIESIEEEILSIVRPPKSELT